MQRRTLLQLGLGTGVALGLAGWGASVWTPGWQATRLSDAARSVFRTVSATVLDGLLPTDVRIRELSLQAQLQRLEATIAGLAPATRAELSDLLALLCTAPGRLALTGLSAPWAQATPAAVAAALQGMRTSSSLTRQQVYHALRDLTNAAWFADAGTWEAVGYPGPPPI